MAVYLIGFALSILLIAYAEKKRLPVFLGLSFLALLIPCLIAGLREQSVGTDVLVYVKPMTEAALSAKNLDQFFDGYWFAQWRNLYVQDYEVGFSMLVYLVARVTRSLPAVLFSIQALMVVPVYIALARNRKDFPVWLGMLLYYFLFFNATLNMMRQWNAMALLLLAFQLLRERKVWLTAILVVIAFFFHKTAIVALPVFMLFWFLWIIRHTRFVQGNLQLQGATIVTALLFFLAVFALMNLSLLLKVLSLVGMGQYSNYLQGNDIQLMASQIVLRLPLLIVLFWCFRSMCRTDSATPFYASVVLLDLVVSQLVSIDDNALRISAYLSMYNILWVPSAYHSCKKGMKRTLVTLLVIAYAVFYWYYTYILQGRHMTYPYVFGPW